MTKCRKVVVGVCVGMLTAVVSCGPRLTSSPKAGGFVGKPFSYSIEAMGEPTRFGATVPPPAGLSVDEDSGVISGVPTESGVFRPTISASNSGGTDSMELEIRIGHPVDSTKELLIVDPAVIQGPMSKSGGAWHFRSVMQRLAGDGADVDAFAKAWFELWAAEQHVGPNKQFAVPPAPEAVGALLEAWQGDGFKLLAIVNRIDLTRFKDGNLSQVERLGEGRLVYEVAGRSFTIIVEFGLPVRNGEPLGDALRRWAVAWHALGESGLSVGEYTQSLAGLVAEFSTGAHLNQVRTNQLMGGNLPWHLREFHLENGRMAQAQTAQSPDPATMNAEELRRYIDDNTSGILSGVFEVPADLVGGISKDGDRVNPGAKSERARFVVSFNTCIGCHTGLETTIQPFQHIMGFSANSAASLSNFMKGEVEAANPANHFPGTSSPRHDEMNIRRMLLQQFSGDVSHDDVKGGEAARVRAVRDAIQARTSRVH